MKNSLCLLFALAVTGCTSTDKTATVVDGTTEVTTNKSITKIHSQLSQNVNKQC